MPPLQMPGVVAASEASLRLCQALLPSVIPPMTPRPLNGTKTHPLNKSALVALVDICGSPKPRQEFNPGIVNRLLREALVESVPLPSPYHTVKGDVMYLRITEAGKAVLVEAARLRALATRQEKVR